MNQAERALVVAEALSWKGTPYVHKQVLKGFAADCALFPLKVYESLDLIAPGPIPEYSEQWFLHHSEELYMNAVIERGAVETTDLDPGNFCLWRVGRCYSHGGIIIKWPVIIHALRPREVMLADATNDGTVCRKPMKVFTL